MRNETTSNERSRNNPNELTDNDLVHAISIKTGLKTSDVRKVLRSLIGVMTREFSDTGSISIRGLGHFQVVRYDSDHKIKIINPLGVEEHIDASGNVAKIDFAPDIGLLKQLNSKRDLLFQTDEQLFEESENTKHELGSYGLDDGITEQEIKQQFIDEYNLENDDELTNLVFRAAQRRMRAEKEADDKRFSIENYKALFQKYVFYCYETDTIYPTVMDLTEDLPTIKPNTLYQAVNRRKERTREICLFKIGKYHLRLLRKIEKDKDNAWIIALNVL